MTSCSSGFYINPYKDIENFKVKATVSVVLGLGLDLFMARIRIDTTPSKTFRALFVARVWLPV